MSATNPSASPAEAPEHIAPQLTPKGPKKHRLRKLWLLAVVVAVGGLVAYRLFSKPQQTDMGGPIAIPTAKVTMGPLERVIRLAGETSARNFASITVPRMRGRESREEITLIELAEAGSFVRTGEVVARIDAQAAQDHIDDVQSTVVQAESDIKKRKAEQAVDWENLQQTLRVAKAQLEQARLDNSAAEVRTTIDQELLKLAVEEAEARYKQLQADLALRQAAHKAELRILEITRDRHALHRDRHANDLKRFTFRAPMNGLVVMQTFYRAGDLVQVEVGDQVRSGQTFMKIVDPSSMELEADANQTESSELRVGQPATILLDAFPEVRLKGKVYSLGAMGVRSWRENYYVRRVPVRITIEGSDPRLIPDLSASAEVVVEREENALTVPLAAVQSENSRRVVFVKNGDGFERRQVELGLQNATQAAVTAGLEAGEEVALESVAASNYYVSQ